MDLREQNFGVEVEMTGITRKRAAQVIGEYLNGTVDFEGGGYGTYTVTDNENRKWKLVSDASITCQKKVGNRKQIADKEYSVELVSPICRYEDIENIQEIIRKLRGAGAFCNKSCGIHIHINSAPFKAYQIRNLVNIVAAKEDMIYKALKVDSERERRYCKKIDKDFLEELNKKKPKTIRSIQNLWYKGGDGSHQHYHDSRYRCLNLHSVFQKGTIEFRAFNGSLHAGKLKAYLQFCMAVTAQAYNQKFASPKKTVSENEKYTFRVWLLRLGLIGDEFKTARKHLLDNLEGNIAWKSPEQAEPQKERLRKKREQELLEQKERVELESNDIEIGEQGEEFPAFFMT
ncbi:Putative amidoligase enzyme [Tissierella praeacuta DSM 18095]|uniref:Putative amidoligase enzyme n=1 Tax=Tissierella praeacuta DSM 18095 TaxID=1123404 RepID=A0A1M4YN61_9FIRM|nr:amidoligase family protein [Tissierella praeacuta]SHF07098.1 Putative amidoligase enzyme [Tissierella praeacuta DSM 18095]SUP02352.1 Putative amidoligase enzyme [Tissierella praeacuta]